MTGLREHWASGATAFGGWCTMGSPFSAELLGSSGFDYVCVDLQHGLSDLELGWTMVQALRGTDAAPVVRVPYNHTPWPGKALDAGAEAVIVPMVNSRADAEMAAAACRYPPLGVRSFGPVRSGLLLGDDPVAVNAAVVCLVMIETVHAVAAADEICSTPGVDGVYIGPADLSVSMSGSLAAMGSQEHADALETVRRACERSGIVPGLHTGGGAQARAYAEAGFKMCTLGTDAALLRTTARNELAVAREGGGGEAGTASSPYG
jgi:4-hydroxy-2-oxoheptanedioate aldolase